jgi:hypothetical protein
VFGALVVGLVVPATGTLIFGMHADVRAAFATRTLSASIDLVVQEPRYLVWPAVLLSVAVAARITARWSTGTPRAALRIVPWLVMGGILIGAGAAYNW